MMSALDDVDDKSPGLDDVTVQKGCNDQAITAMPCQWTPDAARSCKAGSKDQHQHQRSSTPTVSLTVCAFFLTRPGNRVTVKLWGLTDQLGTRRCMPCGSSQYLLRCWGSDSWRLNRRPDISRLTSNIPPRSSLRGPETSGSTAVRRDRQLSQYGWQCVFRRLRRGGIMLTASREKEPTRIFIWVFYSCEVPSPTALYQCQVVYCCRPLLVQ